MNELIVDKGVCRTAPATPGLLNEYVYIKQKLKSRIRETLNLSTDVGRSTDTKMYKNDKSLLANK